MAKSSILVRVANIASKRQYSSPAEGTVPAAKRKYVPTSGTYPKGFLVSGIHVGVKPTNTTNPDLALVISQNPCSAAAVFTKNKFQAAPVTISREVLQHNHSANIRGVVINSGRANAVTGKGGLDDASAMSSAVDSLYKNSLDDTPLSTLVMSTGVIGQRLPISKIRAGIPTAKDALSAEHPSWLNTAISICTTDTFPKLLSRTFTLPSSPGTIYSIAGMTKGAGMIHPNMATLLGILATDAPIAPKTLQETLGHAMEGSFNSISIDGDTSTNDTVAILANGAAAPSRLTQPVNSIDSPDGRQFLDVLTAFTQDLSSLVVRDGEGATKFVKIKVTNAFSKPDAKNIASTIARSPLVKTALYGKDANWGRILCAVGYTPNVDERTVDPKTTSMAIRAVSGSGALNAKDSESGYMDMLIDGEPENVDEERAAKILAEEDLEIRVDLGTGIEEASYWFCDFSHEYVTINGDYRT
ncbi:hypothetical protein MMC09_004679 [Bachmanniomyces sp. S44760]|nr:hypothetical protein [Bachmanniomyces sp. S44760]